MLVNLPAAQASITKLALSGWFFTVDGLGESKGEGLFANAFRTCDQVGMPGVSRFCVVLQISDSRFVTKNVPLH